MIITVLSISRSLVEELKFRPFVGRVAGRFERACNLVDSDGRVIALTLPEVGNGPFSTVIDGWPGCFEPLSPTETAIADSDKLIIDPLHIDLNTAHIWEPRLVRPVQPLSFDTALASIIQPYTNWPDPAAVGLALNRRLVEATARLNQAITQANGEESDEEIAAAASQLAGLGNGLTPAGDDFLVGVMAALWLTGKQSLLFTLAAAAVPRTTTLSAAFLRSAAQGEFIEPWHALAQALCAGEVEPFHRAVERVAQFGASSGRDALAGFAIAILPRLLG